MKIRTAAAAAAIAIAAGTGLGTGIASAAGTPLFSTTTRTEHLVSPRCYSVYQKTVTSYGWSSKAGRYVPYAGGPHTTITASTHCHP